MHDDFDHHTHTHTHVHSHKEQDRLNRLSVTPPLQTQAKSRRRGRSLRKNLGKETCNKNKLYIQRT